MAASDAHGRSILTVKYHEAILDLAASLAVIVVGGVLSGLIRITYLKRVPNNPLVSPVTISRVEGDALVLADGRRLTQFDYTAEDVFEMSDGRIDLEERDGELHAFVSAKLFVCGTPWAGGLVHIPILPSVVPENRREPVGHQVKVTAPNQRLQLTGDAAE